MEDSGVFDKNRPAANPEEPIFVSSTFNDLRRERQAAVDAILTAKHIPAGMELFTAGDESQMATIKRWIDDSDVFMLILGGRYGAVEPSTGKSYTHLEYEYAQAKGKPYFAAVMSEGFLDRKAREDGVEAVERAHTEKLNVFREIVKSKICQFYDDLKDLKLIVIQKLAELIERPELIGWVRGSEVIDTKKTLEEMVAVQTENTTLRNRLSEFESAENKDMFAGVTLDEIAKDLASRVLDLTEEVVRDPKIVPLLKGRNPTAISYLEFLLDHFRVLVSGAHRDHGIIPDCLYNSVGRELERYGLVEYIRIPPAREPFPPNWFCKFNADGLRFMNRLEKLSPK